MSKIVEVGRRKVPKNYHWHDSLLHVLFRAEYKPRGYYLEHFWQADLGYIGQAIIGVKAHVLFWVRIMKRRVRTAAMPFLLSVFVLCLSKPLC